jgi:FixJ family two-component response regulator
MAKIGGRELAVELKKTISHLKVIFVSGYPGSCIAREDLELLGAYFLQKPFSLQLIAKTIRAALDGVPYQLD